MSLITTIAEFKKFVDIDVNAKIDKSLGPYINEAEQLYLVDLLGQAFYDEFVAAYKASVDPSPTPLSADNLLLQPYIQRCVAYYAKFLAIPNLSVTFGDMGVRVHRGEDSDAAARWLIEKLQLECLKNGDTHADKLLEYLENNATNSKYATWFASDANTKKSGYIVYSTAIASQHINISRSRRIFLQLRNTMRDVESKYIIKLIGQAQYDELVAELKAGTVSPDNAKLIDRIQPIVSKRALHIRLPFLRVSIQSDGIWLYSDTNAELRDRGFLAAEEDIDELQCELKDNEITGFLSDEEELRQFILSNIETYPLIKATGVYTVLPDPGPTWTPKNERETKFFSV
jgi:hypothetical protein